MIARGALKLLAALAAPAADAAFRTSISDRRLLAGENAGFPVSCDQNGEALGGGFDPEDVLQMAGTASGPADPRASPPPVSGLWINHVGPAPSGWRVVVRNESATARSFKVAAICVPEPGSAALAAVAVLALARVPRRAA